MKIFLCLCTLILASSGCTTGSMERNPSSSASVMEGTLFKVDIPGIGTSTENRVYDALHKNAPKITRQVMQGLYRGRIGMNQKTVRIMGLDFCRERGFESIGAVFWNGFGNRIIFKGVHCLTNHKQRRRLLGKSYGAGCRELGFRGRNCKRAISKTRQYRFSKISDLRGGINEKAGSSGIDG